MVRIAFALAALAALSACGNLQWPPLPGPQLANPPPHQRGAAGAPKTVTVEGSDTLFSLSKRYGVSPRAIIDANNLQPPYRLTLGQRLTLPTARTHTVVRGDTLNGIARQYGVEPYQLARLNNLAPPYTIHVNRTLVLPGGGEAPAVAAVEVADRGAAPPAPAPRGRSVQKVEIAEEIARDVAPRAVTAPAPPRPREPIPAARAAPAPQAELASLPPQSGPVAAPRTAGRGRGASRFIWPVQGKIVSEYGTKGEGLHNDGINIVAPKGATVVAAAPGVVAYAGNEIRGFGNLLLIRHADGWTTAYAHNDKLLVKRGDAVRQGQPIANVGATGNVISPQLHFEIRRGKRAVDPLDQLGSQRSS